MRCEHRHIKNETRSRPDQSLRRLSELLPYGSSAVRITTGSHVQQQTVKPGLPLHAPPTSALHLGRTAGTIRLPASEEYEHSEQVKKNAYMDEHFIVIYILYRNELALYLLNQSHN